MSTATYAPTNQATAFSDPLRSTFGAQLVGSAYAPGLGLGLDPQVGQYGQQFGQLGQFPLPQQHHLQQAIAQQVQQQQIQQAIAQQIQQQQVQQAIARHWQQGHSGAMYGSPLGSPYGQQMWN